MIPALPATSAPIAAEAVATVGEAAVTAAVVVAAIDAENPGKSSVIYRNDACLDSFQYSFQHQFGIA
jgi:hypothetical protein